MSGVCRKFFALLPAYSVRGRAADIVRVFGIEREKKDGSSLDPRYRRRYIIVYCVYRVFRKSGNPIVKIQKEISERKSVIQPIPNAIQINFVSDDLLRSEKMLQKGGAFV